MVQAYSAVTSYTQYKGSKNQSPNGEVPERMVVGQGSLELVARKATWLERENYWAEDVCCSTARENARQPGNC